MQKKKAFLYIFCLFLLSGLFFGCGEKPVTYTASGYVLEDGVGVEGVKVSTSYGYVLTNSEGFYSIYNLMGSTQISVSKDDCVFEVSNKVFYPNNEEPLNFEAYKFYDLSGTVTQGGLAVSNATVTATGKKSGRTVTDQNGNFVIQNVAGEVSVEVESTQSSFLTYVADKINNQLLIDSVCELKGKVVENGVGVRDIMVVSGGNSTYTDENGEFVLNKDSNTNQLQFVNNEYHFDNDTLTITNALQDITVNVNKKYSASGSVVCGNQVLAEAKVYSKNNPNNFVLTDQNGLFELTQLYGSDTLIVEKQGFVVDELNVTEQAENKVLTATFTLTGEVVSDDNSQNDFVVSVNGKTATTKNGQFSLAGVCFGERVVVSKDGYISFDNLAIENTNAITLNIKKLFTLTGNILVDGVATANIVVRAGDKQTITDQDGNYLIVDLYGNHNILVDEQKYFVESFNNDINFNNCNVNINLFEYYDAELTLKALGQTLSSSNVKINSQTFTTDENGLIKFNKIFGEKTYVCEIEDYNSQITEVNKTQNSGIVEFTFDVCGYAKSGDLFIEGAKIAYGADFVLTDENGFYKIENLTEQVELSASKDFYNFESSCVANKNQTANFEATYTISGNLVIDADVTTIVLYLYSYSTEQTVQITPDANGDFTFENLSGKYYLYFDKNITTNNLKPTGYQVLQGNNNYDFSSTGYSVSGVVTCGDLILNNVKLTAGTSNTKTDEYGNFAFDVLFGECTITPQLKGYTFSPSSITVDETMDGTTDLVFTATYGIAGKITCGTQNLEGVEIKLKGTDITATTNQNGEYSFDSLSGKYELEISKQGYTFVGETKVNGFGEFNFTATYSVSGYAICGEKYIAGVQIKTLSQTVSTDENGYFTLTGLVFNEELSAEKTGYNFGNSIVVNQPTTEILFSATYSVSGKVTSGTIAISGATISYGEQTLTTDENGYFEVSGLTDTIIFTASKQNYDSKTLSVSESSNSLTFNLSYSISGLITSIDGGLEGVSVIAQGQTTTTDVNGAYTLTNLYGEGMLIVEKEGYKFVGETSFNVPTTLNFSSTFSIKGRVLTGDLPIANILVYYLQTNVVTDENGYFTIENVNQKIQLTLIKDGYNPITTEEFNQYQKDLTYNLTYNVSGKITGDVSVANVKVVAVCGETTFETTTNEQGSYSFDKLFGRTVITFTKDQTKIDPTTFATDKPITKDAKAYEIYTVRGKITAGDLAVSNMPLYVGKNIVGYTNANGEYVLNGLYDKSSIIARFSASNCTTLETEQFDTTTGATKDFTLNQNDYIYWLFEKGYQNLRESNSYSSTLTGQVDAGAGGIQSVGGFRKKGTNGVYLKEDTNYGAEKFGVDPKVAVMTYYNPANPNNVSYIHHKNVNAGPSPDYTGTSWTDTTLQAYSTKYGIQPTDFTPYIINRNTINSFDDISVADGITTFTLNLDPKNATTNYKIRMNAYSGQTPSGFNHVKLTYKIDSDGNLISLSIDESYNVTVVITVTCTAKLTETFTINDSSVGAITKPTF